MNRRYQVLIAVLGAAITVSVCSCAGDEADDCVQPAGETCSPHNTCEGWDLCHWDPDNLHVYPPEDLRGTCAPYCPETCCPSGWSCGADGLCLPDGEPAYCDRLPEPPVSEMISCAGPFSESRCNAEGTVESATIVAGAGGEGFDALDVVLADDQASVRVPVPAGTGSPVAIGERVRVIGQSGAIELRGADGQPLVAIAGINYWDEPPLLVTADIRSGTGAPLCAPRPAPAYGKEKRNDYVQVTAMDFRLNGGTEAELLASVEPGQSADVTAGGLRYRVTSCTGAWVHFYGGDLQYGGTFSIVRLP